MTSTLQNSSAYDARVFSKVSDLSVSREPRSTGSTSSALKDEWTKIFKDLSGSRINAAPQKSSESTFDVSVASIASRPSRLLVITNVQPGNKKVQERLQELIRLEPGWDGYYGAPVSFDNAVFALRMLETICNAQTPAPQIVPGSEGDLQIEWHTLEGDVELHVKGPNDVHATRWLCEQEQEDQISLTNDFLTVAVWVKDIAEFSIGAKTSAT